MIPALLGKKVGMTQVFDEHGMAIPVTVVEAGPCAVMQVRDQQTDGYDAVQLGFGDAKPHRSTKPLIGHAHKADTTPRKVMGEVRLSEPTSSKLGDVITVNIFAEHEVKYVDVVGISKGRGFAGVMKRYGFGGQPASHGVERKHRSPGSISGHGSDLGGGGNLKKGKRMCGHYGHARATIKNQRLMGIDEENSLLLIEGSVPGPNQGYVLVRQAKTKS